ncbi:hypothetical protein [Burkholderia cepacia]|uniref:hypothetical protein n=1 Tax=Burkholderia cepacia TaxID=292 RepID=UPI00398F4ABA
MADEIQHEEKPARGIPDNVVELDAYRSKKRGEPQATRGSPPDHEEKFEVEAHLFVDICSDGETRFGVVGADGDNAIWLLEPIFILGQQLVQLTET